MVAGKAGRLEVAGRRSATSARLRCRGEAYRKGGIHPSCKYYKCLVWSGAEDETRPGIGAQELVGYLSLGHLVERSR
jgi:hypothetical protein